MAYNNNIPQPTDNISTQSQADLLENFAQLETQFSVNHTSLLAGADNGKHIHTTYLDQGANPATAANEVAMYAKDLGGVSTLYFRKESNGTVIQMTGQDPTSAAQGSTFLPGGVILKWGSAAIVSGAGGTTVNFTSAFPTTCWQVVVTPNDANALYASVISTGAASFVARGSNACTIKYIAIGN